MRTWLVLAAVLAVAAAAVADALHRNIDHGAHKEELEVTPASRVVPPGVPAGFMGAVYFSDPDAGCRLRTLGLPGFEQVDPPAFRGCQFALSPDGTQVFPGEANWSPDGGRAAIPRGSTFELASPSAHRTILVTGSSPAFKPDGTLTFSRRNRLLEWASDCRAGDRPFTVPADSASGRCVRTIVPEGVKSLAWLTNERFVAVLADGELEILDGRRVVARRRLPDARGARLEPSPTRRFFALWVGGRLFGAFDRDGAEIALPPLPDIRSVAWSPSERWAVLATKRGSVYIFRTGTGDARLRRLDIRARDLAWR